MPVRAELFRIVLRHGIAVENALEPTLEFLHAYPSTVAEDASPTASFGEDDLRRANRGGARISAAEIAAVLERKGEIERWLRGISPDSSLAGAARSIPWSALGGLFEAFAGIRGIGLSKVTKTLHPKRPALIPMLDSVVRAYLEKDDLSGSDSFGKRPRRSSAATRTISTRIEVPCEGSSASLPVAGTSSPRCGSSTS